MEVLLSRAGRQPGIVGRMADQAAAKSIAIASDGIICVDRLKRSSNPTLLYAEAQDDNS